MFWSKSRWTSRKTLLLALLPPVLFWIGGMASRRNRSPILTAILSAGWTFYWALGLVLSLTKPRPFSEHG